MIDGDGYGDRLRAECRTCDRVETATGTHQAFKNLEREFGEHIDDGSACHDYAIYAESDEGEWRII